MRAEVLRAAPPTFQLVFADSCDAAHQAEAACDADFLLAGFASIDAALVARRTRLTTVHKWGIGIDSIDLNVLRARGIALAITAGGNAGPVAELALALMLSVYRRLPYVQRTLREGRWVTSEMRETGLQVSKKTIGLPGFGHIARALARRLSGFDAGIFYFDPKRAKPAVEASLKVEYQSTEKILRSSDIVSLHMPLHPSTTKIINVGFLAKIKDGAVLINTARGGIVDG